MHISRQMLRLGAAAVVVAIGCNALAAPILSASFEGAENGSLATNLPGWSSEGADQSVITNWNNAYALASTVSPLTNSVSHTNVLQLATEGDMLSLTNGAPEDLTAGSVYVDGMIRFTVSDTDPDSNTITNDTKIAVFVNSSSNLVIRHMMSTNAYGEGVWSLADVGVTNSVTDKTIDPDAWYRLTIRLRNSLFKDPTGNDFSTEFFRTYGEVQLNGVIITNVATAYSNTLFFSCAAVESSDLNAVSLSGTGFLDDLVVTKDVPVFLTAVVYAYVIEEYIDTVGPTYIAVSSENEFAAGWSKLYAAPSDAWRTNRLDSGTAVMFALDADGRTVTSPAPGGSNDNTTNVLNVLLDQAKTAGELPAQFTGLTADQITWIRNFGKTPADPLDTDENDLAFEQAMKLDPYVNEAVTNQITSFTVGTPNSMIVVKALTNGVAYASASGLTVNVLIDVKASLTNAWPAAAEITNAVTQFNVLGEATNTFLTPAGTFFRARIVEQP